jgi:hypothetical protein
MGMGFLCNALKCALGSAQRDVQIVRDRFHPAALSDSMKNL